MKKEKSINQMSLITLQSSSLTKTYDHLRKKEYIVPRVSRIVAFTVQAALAIREFGIRGFDYSRT